MNAASSSRRRHRLLFDVTLSSTFPIRCGLNYTKTLFGSGLVCFAFTDELLLVVGLSGGCEVDVCATREGEEFLFFLRQTAQGNGSRWLN